MKIDTRTRVFVYGTLKPGGRYHEEFCGCFTFRFEPAKIEGQLFTFPNLNYPGAIEVSDYWIEGILLQFVESPSQVLTKLDELEGFNPDRDPRLNEYYRKEVQVYEQKTERPLEEAWCYFMDGGKIRKDCGIPIPTGPWEERGLP